MKNRRLPALIALVTIAAFAAFSCAGAPTPPAAPAWGAPAEYCLDNPSGAYAPMLFRASKGDSSIFLFGSIHVGDPSFYPMPDAVEKAFESAGTLAVEADVVDIDQGALLAYMMGKAMFKDGKKLSDYLTPEATAALMELGKAYGIGGMIDSYMPWFVLVLVSGKETEGIPYDIEHGTEMGLLKRAKAAGKAIVEVEGAIPQLDLLSSPSIEDQVEYLEYILLDEAPTKEASLAELEALVSAWKRGDLRDIEATLAEMRKVAPGYSAVFLDRRNAGMAAKAASLIDAGGSAFFTVGAAHFVGPEGIPALLAGKGYKVERVKY